MAKSLALSISRTDEDCLLSEQHL